MLKPMLTPMFMFMVANSKGFRAPAAAAAAVNALKSAAPAATLGIPPPPTLLTGVPKAMLNRKAKTQLISGVGVQCHDGGGGMFGGRRVP